MKRIAALVLLACLSANTYALETFVVSDIRIDGLQRINAGTVFSYLPVEKGDKLTQERAGQAIRALYKTGFFNDVQLNRQGNILVITVQERPAIAKILIKGNKDIKEEDLMKGLKDIGLTEGEPFDRLQLDRVTQELVRQYNNRGKYNVTIKPKILNLDRNRIELNINIAEGKAAAIKHINIVGNHTFDDGTIRDEFESGTTNWTSWYSKNDQYSREKLSGDLEKLNSYYLDRGYVDFNTESTEVSMSPDKRDMYIVASVREGEIYKVSDIKLAGNLILKEDDLRKLVKIHSGEIFSRNKLEKSAEAMTGVLANIGYAFAEVTPVPTVDREKREVAINFVITPGKRVYVHRINFKGNTNTADEVIRREMRQLEGAWYSQAAIDRSKIRLQRLGYFKKVDITTPRVPGTDDQVDLNVTIEETSSGSFTFGLGYSQVQKFIASVSVSQNNLFGSGDRAAFTVSQSYYEKRYDISYFNPYLTDDGISIGYDVSLRKLNQSQANIAEYLSDTASFSTYLGIPVSESDTVNMKLGVDKTRITTFSGVTPNEIIDYITLVNRGIPTPLKTFHQWSTELSWAHDTRNKFFNPTHGSLLQLSAELTLPGSTLSYYKLVGKYTQYFPITDRLTFQGSATIGYGDGYGSDKHNFGLPFYENFYAGGVADVRGFKDNTLGPSASPLDLVQSYAGYAQPLGGALKTVASAEVIFPTPFVKDDNTTTRLSAFLDVGNVFNSNIAQNGVLKTTNNFSVSDLRASAGLSFRWQAPVGPIVINLSRPIRKKVGDQTETLQFTFGSQF